MSESDREYLSIGDAAELVGVSRFKLWRWVKEGRLAAYQSEADRRQKLVLRADVLALVSPQRIETDDMGKAAA